MTRHRGRHRRRKRGRALRGVLAGTALALTAAATMISASQATVDDDPGALKPLTSRAELNTLRLSEDLVPERSLDRLATRLGRPVGVDAVLADADRTLREPADCTTAERAALPVAPEATRSYCWDAADTRGWRSGPVTTSGDADDDGRWGERRVLLSAWSDGSASRVAFVDATELDRLRYTWVRLTVPTDDGRVHRPLRSAVSGMVWYQDKLLVTARDDLYVYDMHRVQRATGADGSRFVLPAVGVYRSTGASPVGLSLDRTTSPDSLVARGGDRLWRYAFSADPDRTGLLATGRATEAFRSGTDGPGGVLSYRSRWYVAQAGEEHGTLWRQGTGGALTTQCGAHDSHRCWSGSTPSLSYWQETGEVWSQSGRTLFALPLSSIDRSLE
ncbi:secreted protein [Streptomyces davaonensis JCM 4913]|uniref:Secreted protein n=1 Tax=Streptomyces davaonensis (strain DSM 101723 / JCM 4913 / KCC S-0913 / 768) TaxID=1214101 RepID=K4R0H2_STRDJ|nr:hypothetical protein [Streptomyces davaonensis]CCK26600.1 secreted protein [Streptomyces davaonensis JCM 4913]